MIQSWGGHTPTVHESAFVHPTATLIGDVTLEADTSIWPGTVVRGDRGSIVIGEGSNIQDNAVCHETVEIGDSVTVGHSAVIHNCTLGDRSLVGINAVVLDGSTVGDDAMVAAGSVVTEDTEVPAGSMVAGTPATVIKEDVGDTPWAAAEHYVMLVGQYRESAEVIQE